jgi:hypothetical protein
MFAIVFYNVDVQHRGIIRRRRWSAAADNPGI